MHKPRILALSLSFIAATLLLPTPHADARYEAVQLRKLRQEKANERWSSPSRVTINVHYRVPVIETLGYLAAFYPDSQKLTTIAKRLQPIAAQVHELSGESFHGRSFPPEVQEQCSRLHSELFTAVDEVYGKAVSERIQNYLQEKYKHLTGGLFSTIEG